jgi:hypothetical protein
MMPQAAVLLASQPVLTAWALIPVSRAARAGEQIGWVV